MPPDTPRKSNQNTLDERPLEQFVRDLIEGMQTSPEEFERRLVNSLPDRYRTSTQQPQAPGGEVITSPEEYYASCKGQTRYMRNTLESFEARLAKGERKCLRKLERFYSVARVKVSDCYPIIEWNRSRKGRKYGMPREAWDRYEAEGIAHCFALYPGPIAAALCVPVMPDTLYVSGWGDIESAEKLSPVVMLAKGIYDWCRSHGFKTLDIGIADEPGLIAFKRRLGFEAKIL